MGMFQPQNYGADFVNAMTATSGMLNDRRKLEMEEKRQARDEETRGIQNEGLKLENQKKTADLDREKRLTSFLDLTNRMQSGQLQPQDYGTLAGVTSDLMQETPYLPSDPAEIPKYKQSINQLLQGVQAVRNLPVGNYTYTRADNNPQVNQALDGFRTLLSKDRLGKEFTDTDGSVTGKAGSTYRTADVGGFSMVSGNGQEAAFVPMFSVTDAQGNPLVRQDGKPVLVPSTVGQTNGPDDKVRLITPEEMMTKAGFAYKVLDTADKLGLADPEKRKEYIASTLPTYMGEKGAEMVLKANQKDKTLHGFATDQDIYSADGKLIRAATPKDKYITVPEGGKLVEATTGIVMAEGNAKKETPHTTTAGVGGGMEQTFQYNPATGKYDIAIGKPTAKHKASGEGEGAKAAKVGTINAVKAALVRRYIPVAKAELKRQGKSEDAMMPTEEDKALGLHVNPSAVYGALGDTGRKVYDRAATLAEQYAASGKVTPENAVERALADARREFNLDSGGKVQQSPPTKPAAQPPAQARGMVGPAKQAPAKQQTAKTAARPPLSAFNKR